MHGTFRAGFLLEHRNLVRELSGIARRDRKLPCRELHFADVYHSIASCKKHIDLRTALFPLAPPRAQLRQHAANAQRFFDLAAVHEADPLKRQSLPRPALWQIGCH